MNLVAITCMHKRHALNRVWLSHMRSLGVPVYVVITAGDTANGDLCHEFSAHWTYANNRPLGAKFNRLAAYAPKWHNVMLLGSDDLPSAEWIEQASAALDEGHDYILPTSCAIYHVATGNAVRLVQDTEGPRVFGAGRVFSARARALVPELWPPLKERGLDGCSHRRLIKVVPPHYVHTERPPVVDVKSGFNLWPYRTWAESGHARPISRVEALHMVSTEHFDAIHSLK